MNDHFSNNQPGTPSEDEIFEHFLGRAAPELSRRVSAYLKENPDKERELREWALIETHFEKFPIQSPNSLVLNRVRNMAREQVSRPASSGWFAAMKARFSTREWALVFTLVVAVLLSHGMRETRLDTSDRMAASTAIKPSSSSNLLASRTEPSTDVIALPNTMTPADEVILALTNYDAAVDLYQAGSFKEANRGFAEVVSNRPNFEKRRELYTYWVESLKKLGKYALAEKKQKVLEDIVAEEGKSH